MNEKLAPDQKLTKVPDLELDGQYIACVSVDALRVYIGDMCLDANEIRQVRDWFNKVLPA